MAQGLRLNLAPQGQTPPAGKGDLFYDSDLSPAGLAWIDETGLVTRLTGGGKGDVFNVKDYGAVGDGVTDDTTAINAAITACNAAGGGTVFVPPGTYMVNADYNGGFGIRMKSFVTLLGSSGAELKAIANALTSYGVITALGAAGIPVTDIAIRDLRVTGERSTHTGITGEFGHGIQLYGVLRAVIENCTVTECWGDGIYLGSGYVGTEPCQDIRVLGCVAKHNRRNNMSVVGCLRGQAIGCEFINATGTAPQAGVDLEPDYANNVQDFTVDACAMVDNAGYGAIVTATAANCKIVNCSVRRSGLYSIAVGAVDTVVANNQISEVTSATRGTIEVGSTAVRVLVQGNTIRNVEAGNNHPAIYVHGSATDVQVRGNFITNANTLVATGGTGVINVGAPKTQVSGNYIYNSVDLGIVIATGAADCHVIDNTIDTVVSRAIYVDAARPVIVGNTLRDVSSVTNGMMQLTANATESVVSGNMAVLTTPNTAIVPYYVLVAPRVFAGNGYSGTKTHATGYVSVAVSADQGDASVTVLPDGSEDVIRYATALTTTRTVTLSTTRAYVGCTKRVVREATATGSSGLSVGGLITLAVGEWALVLYNGSAWELVGAGLLSAVAGVYAPLASPTFTGTPTLPTGTIGTTQTANDNSTKLATTAYVDRATTHTGTTSAAPTGTTSATAVMMGLAGSITPTRGTKIIVMVTGQMSNNTINDGATVDLRFGTGAAPTNGAAVTGTLVGIAQTFTALVAAQRDGFCLMGKVTGLSVGTAYWLDLSLLAVTGGTATVTGVSITAFEVP